MPVVDRETFAPNAAARYAASHATPSSDVASAVARALARQDIGLETSPAHLNGCREDLQPLINRLRLVPDQPVEGCELCPDVFLLVRRENATRTYYLPPF